MCVGLDNISAAAGSGVFTGSGNDQVSVRSATLGESLIGGQGGEDTFNVLGTGNDLTTFRTFEGTLEGGVNRTNAVFFGLVRNDVRLGTVGELARFTPELSTLYGALTATGLDKVAFRSAKVARITFIRGAKGDFEKRH